MSDGTIDLLGSGRGFALALLVGTLFGFWLERAGFGSSRRLTAIFFRRDFAVLKVMFTAIATAAVGLEFLGERSWLDLESIHRPDTIFLPQLVGGLIFGVGFVAGGYCPGTALVGLASAKLDALAFLVGAGGGSLAFAFAWPVLEDFAGMGFRGRATLPDLLGISPAMTTGLVVILAIASFAAAARLVRHPATT